MNARKIFIKELSFLEEYGFIFVDESTINDEKYVYRKNKFEIVFLSRINQFDYLCEFYYSSNGWKTILDIDYEYKQTFNKKSLRNYYWQLGKILREQLKSNKIFGFEIK